MNRPVHELPPRRYAGEGAPRGPSEDARACRQLLRAWRAARGPERAPDPPRAPGRRRRRKGSSRYFGVSWVRRRGYWQAHVSHQGRTLVAGTSTDEVEAARMHDRVEWALRGDPARLNFPDQRGDEPWPSVS